MVSLEYRQEHTHSRFTEMLSSLQVNSPHRPQLPPAPSMPAPPPPRSLSPVQESSHDSSESLQSPKASHRGSSNAPNESEEYQHPYARHLEQIEDSFADLMDTVEERIQESIAKEMRDSHDKHHESIVELTKRVEQLGTKLHHYALGLDRLQEHTDAIFGKLLPFAKLIQRVEDEVKKMNTSHDQLKVTVGNISRKLNTLEKDVLAKEIAANDERIESEMRKNLAEKRMKAAEKSNRVAK